MAASTSTTPSRLRHCLNDVGYPADKDALLEAAARNGCDHETARALRAIPPETYANLSPVNPIVEELGENRGS